MKIDVPLFALRHGQVSGVESAVYNLMRGLHARGAELGVAYSHPRHVAPPIADWIAASHIEVSRYPAMGAGMKARFAEESLFALLHRSGQVLFPNYFLPVWRPRIRQTAVLIHDLQHRDFPESFTPRKVAWLDAQYRRTLGHADRIFFISNFELEQAQRHFGTGFTERARVIYNAIDWSRFGNEGDEGEDFRRRFDRPFILAVAHQYAHKRLHLLVEAFGRMAAGFPEIDLVLVGRETPAIRAVIFGALPEELRGRVHLTGFIADTELGYLYRRAEIFALPSLYEGFGMPAIEALGFGTPTLLADASAVPEVTLGLGNYLPSSADSGEWAAELTRLIGCPRVDADVIARVRDRYAPQTVADSVLAALG
jgi:glycosyltransferase involved in cell wall biosynthesis